MVFKKFFCPCGQLIIEERKARAHFNKQKEVQSFLRTRFVPEYLKEGTFPQGKNTGNK